MFWQSLCSIDNELTKVESEQQEQEALTALRYSDQLLTGIISLKRRENMSPVIKFANAKAREIANACSDD